MERYMNGSGGEGANDALADGPLHFILGYDHSRVHRFLVLSVFFSILEKNE